MLDPAVYDKYTVNAPFDGICTAFDLGDHAVADDALCNKLFCVVKGDAGDKCVGIVFVTEDSRNIREGDKAFSLKLTCDLCRRSISIDIVGVTLFVAGDS